MLLSGYSCAPLSLLRSDVPHDEWSQLTTKILQQLSLDGRFEGLLRGYLARLRCVYVRRGYAASDPVLGLYVDDRGGSRCICRTS